VSRLVDRWVAELQEVIGPAPDVVVHVTSQDGMAIERILPGEQTAITLLHAWRPGAGGHPSATLPVPVDVRALPLADSSADLVTCVDLLEDLPTYRPAVAELARITRGRCVVSVPWDPWFRLGNLAQGREVRRLGGDPDQEHAFTPKRLVRALRRGFRDVELHPCFPRLVAECRGPRA
jgi:hypothetical protein